LAKGTKNQNDVSLFYNWIDKFLEVKYVLFHNIKIK